MSLPLPVYVLGTFVKLIELAQSAETLVAAKAELTSAKRVEVRRSREIMVEWRDMMGAKRQRWARTVKRRVEVGVPRNSRAKMRCWFPWGEEWGDKDR